MRGSRLLLLGCTLCSLVACSDHLTVPKSSGPIYGGADNTPPGQLQEIQGVVEMVGDFTFGVRLGDELVILLYSDTDALANALGREVIVRGTFISSREFVVASVRIADPDDL